MNEGYQQTYNPSPMPIFASGCILALAFWCALLLGLAVGLAIVFIGFGILRLVAMGIFATGGAYGLTFEKWPLATIIGTIAIIAIIAAGVWFGFLQAALHGVALHPHDERWLAVMPFAAWTFGLATLAAIAFFTYCAIARSTQITPIVTAFTIIAIVTFTAWYHFAAPHIAAVYAVSPVSRVPAIANLLTHIDQQQKRRDAIEEANRIRFQKETVSK